MSLIFARLMTGQREATPPRVDIVVSDPPVLQRLTILTIDTGAFMLDHEKANGHGANQ